MYVQKNRIHCPHFYWMEDGMEMEMEERGHNRHNNCEVSGRGPFRGLDWDGIYERILS